MPVHNRPVYRASTHTYEIYLTPAAFYLRIFFIESDIHFTTDVKFQTGGTVKTEQSKSENPRYQESLDYLELQDISSPTNTDVKFEDDFISLDYKAETPVKSEIDDMQMIIKDEVGIDESM